METKRLKSAGTTRRAAIFAAGLIVFAGLLTAGAGISRADTIQTEGSYPSREACQGAGPGATATTPGNWNNFWCVPDRTAAGNWRLVLSN